MEAKPLLTVAYNPNTPAEAIMRLRELVAKVAEDGGYASVIYPRGSEVSLLPATAGLTRREEFAAAAMQGILANPFTAQCYVNQIKEGKSQPEDYAKDVVRAAVGYADRLQAELNKAKQE